MRRSVPKSTKETASITTDQESLSPKWYWKNHSSLFPHGLKVNLRFAPVMTWPLSQPFEQTLEQTLDACVVGQYTDEAKLRQQKWKTWAADTYRKDTVFTHHQPEWMAQKQSSNCWAAICVVNGDRQMVFHVPLGGSNSSGRANDLIWLWSLFLLLWQTFVAAKLKQLRARPCYNLYNKLLFEKFFV